jgi:hypothetical protein
MPIVRMSDPIIVPLPVYYGTSDTRNGRPVFPKTGLFLCPHGRVGMRSSPAFDIGLP